MKSAQSIHETKAMPAQAFYCFSKLTCLVFLVLLSLGVKGQPNIKFSHLTSSQGLSQSTVQTMLKDRYGFLWFGTEDGLNRYDGYSFKVYRRNPKDAAALASGNILSLCEDRKGDLWVGTFNGAFLFDRKHEQFISLRDCVSSEELTDQSVTAIYEDKQDNLWIGTYWMLNQVNRKTGKLTQFGNDPDDPASISNNEIKCIFEDSKSNLWVGTASGLNLLDRRTKKFKRFIHSKDSLSLTGNAVSAIFEDAEGRLWVGTDKGLNLFDYNTRGFKRFRHSPGNTKSLGHDEITSIQNAGKNQLWIGTTEGLELFDTEKNIFTHFRHHPSIPTSLNKNSDVTTMLHDRDGILWVGTFEGGINKYDEQNAYFDHYKHNPDDQQTLSNNLVACMAQGSQGDIWIGTDGGGLNFWRQGSQNFVHYFADPADKNSPASNKIISLYAGKTQEYLWIGTYDKGLSRYDLKTNTFKHYAKGDKENQLNNNAVFALLEDRMGNLWIGTDGGGVNMLNQSTGTITKYKTEEGNDKALIGDYVRSLCEDRNGNIWIGTSGGLSVLNPATQSFINYSQRNSGLACDIIFCIYEDSKGNIWIGGLGGGLNKIAFATKKLSTYTTYDGLPDNTINAIVEDDHGRLWISTNNGISYFDPGQEVFKNMDVRDGIGMEFSKGAGLKTPDGKILFGSLNGFTVIHPDRLIKNNNIPPVLLTGLKLFNVPVIAGQANGILQEGIPETKEITLSYKQSMISFEFTALGFTVPEKNQYAYMLEGFDKDWIFTGSNRTATYTNLNPGSYTFRVKASNNDGIWNEKGTSITIVIKPPFWQTWWFRLVAALLAATSIIVAYKIRVRAIQAQKRILEQQVEERTLTLHGLTKELEKKNKELEQFAYVASHDLREPLRTITSFIDLLQNQYKGKLDEKADKYLNFIISAAERMKVLINDLLEYSRIGRKKDGARIECNELVRQVLNDLHVAICETKAEIRTTDLPVIYAYPTEMKQLFQNLISNAMKFRKKDTKPEIHISAENLNDHWQFRVQDNGIGIDPKHRERIFVIFQRLHTRDEYEGSGIGLSNCRKIVELHGGKIWVESTPGAGSSFYFTIKKTNEDRSS